MDELAGLADPRKPSNGTRHDFQELLVMTIAAVLSDCDTMEDVVEWSRMHESWLRRFMVLKHGIPSEDTFLRIFRLLDPKGFEACFRRWVGQVVTQLNGTIAVDGKTVRGSGTGGEQAIQMVSAFATELGLVLGQEKVASKSNEITAIPELLKLLDIGGCTITIDAMGCQKAIAKQIADQGAHYVLSLKGNQRHMFNVCKKHFESAEADRGQQTFSDSDKGHGRIETRKYQVSALPPALQRAAQHWPQLQSVVRVVRTRQLLGQERVSEQTSYYLSSLSAHTSAQQMAQYIRGHWSVENQLHWSLDVGMGDDSGLSQKDHAAHNQALLRRMAQQMLQADTSVKAGLKAKRKRAGWDLTYLERVMGLCI